MADEAHASIEGIMRGDHYDIDEILERARSLKDMAPAKTRAAYMEFIRALDEHI